MLDHPITVPKSTSISLYAGDERVYQRRLLGGQGELKCLDCADARVSAGREGDANMVERDARCKPVCVRFRQVVVGRIRGAARPARSRVSTRAAADAACQSPFRGAAAERCARDRY